MKRTTAFVLVLLAPLAVGRAQFLSGDALGGAVLGGLAGGIIGHNSHGHTAEGVAIGAGAGLLLGSLFHEARERERYYVEPAPVVVAPGYYGYEPGYYAPSRPNYAVAGTVLGGIAGGVIGHNSGGHTAEGVAIGAGAGLLLGGVAEQAAWQRERTLYMPASTMRYYPPPVGTASAPANAGPQASTVVNDNYSPPVSASPMSSANSLFGR